MKKNVFECITFGLLGAVAGYFAAVKLLKTKYEEEARAEIDDVKKYYHDKCSNAVSFTQVNNAPTPIKRRPIEEDQKEDEDNYKKIVTRYDKPDLSSLAQNQKIKVEPEHFDNEDNEEDENEEEDDEDEDPQLNEVEEIEEAAERSKDMAKVNRAEPYLIDFDQFTYENDHYDKLDLYYYKSDDVVCDDNDQKIENPEDVIGWDVFKQLEMTTNAFVRNEKLKIDYEIHAIYGSYEEDVFGRVETDKEKDLRRKARLKRALDERDENE